MLYNQANCFYKLDNLEEANRLYRDVARFSDDKKLVSRAKFNLGNCHFNQGTKLEQTDPKKAIEEIGTGAKYYREALDLDPKDKSAANNIAIARKKIRELKKILKEQQKQDKQMGDKQDDKDKKDQDQQNQDQQGDGKQGDKQQDDQDKKDEQDKKDQKDKKDQEQSQQDQQQQQEQKQVAKPDTTAQEILDKERQRREQYIKMLKGRWKPVDKDW